MVHSPHSGHSGLRGNIPVRHHGRNSKRNQFPLVTADWTPARDKHPASPTRRGGPTLQWIETGVLGRKIDRVPRISSTTGKGKRARTYEYGVRMGRGRGKYTHEACISHGQPWPAASANTNAKNNRTPRAQPQAKDWIAKIGMRMSPSPAARRGTSAPRAWCGGGIS